MIEDEYEPHVVLSSVPSALHKGTFGKVLLSKIATEKKHSPIEAKEVTQKFAIGLDMAKKTIEVTTQRDIRYAVHPINRRYRIDNLDLHRKRLRGHWYMDSMFVRHKFLLGNKVAHVI